MVVHIAPIGTETAHVIEWLRSGPIEKIYLLHSKKTAEFHFPKKARDLEKQIKKLYPEVEINKRVIESAFNLDDTQDAITNIIYYERDENNVENQEIAINVTGGTAVQAAAAVLSAYKHGTKAYYILHRGKNKNLKEYVVPLPIPSMNIGKMNKYQQLVLGLISEGTFERIDIEKISLVSSSKDEGWQPKRKTMTWKTQHDFCTCGHWEEKHPKKSTHRKRAIRECEEPKCTCKKFEVKITGAITKKKLLEKLGLDKSVPYKILNKKKKIIGQRKMQKGATRISAIAKELVRKGYITKIKEIETFEKISSVGGRSEFKKDTTSGVLYKITPAGRRQAKDTIMQKT